MLQHLAGRNHVATPEKAAVTGATDTSATLLSSICFDACMFAQPCFVFSMKLGTFIINFMLLNVLVGKLY
jgi:hypothetical protein